MSPLGWYLVLVAVEGAFLVVGLRYLSRFGAFAARMEQAARHTENAVIELRAYVAGVRDLHRDHPVIPPDGLPDPVQEKEVA
jgi:hypothetical protein